MKLVYATGNKLKFKLAESVAKDFGVDLIQKELAIDEIQGEDIEKIARDKSAKAFSLLASPVVTSDDSWSIPALNGFPGPYMKSLNSWLSTDDFLRLFSGLKNREVILTQIIVYQDKEGQKVLSRQTKGRLLNEARGHLPNSPNQEIITLDGDNGKSIAEVFNDDNLENVAGTKVWPDFFEWYTQK